MNSARPGETREAAMERENQELLALVREARLKGSPSGDQRCDNCTFYVAEYKKIAYCSEPRVEILVGFDWWCQWWESKASAQP
jgi:hypothetical protein